MHRRWVRQWRKEMDSEVWSRPPLTYKIWRFLLMSADYHTGTMSLSGPRIAEALQWEENNAPVVPDRKTIGRHLEWLEQAGMIVTKISGSSSRRYYDITICNWALYNPLDEGLATEIPAGLPQASPSSRRSTPRREEESRARERVPYDTATVSVVTHGGSAADFVPTDPAYVLDPHYSGQDHLDLWQDLVGQLQPAYHMDALNAFQRLHQYFKRTPAQIGAMVQFIAHDDFAKKCWGANPAKLITRAKDGVGHTYATVEHQMQTQRVPAAQRPIKPRNHKPGRPAGPFGWIDEEEVAT